MVVQDKYPIRVGFDFDGVLFYNPVRLLRPLFDAIRTHILHVPRTTFYVSKSPASHLIMRVVHATSFMPNVGMREFQVMLHDPRFDVKVITARQKFLAGDLFFLLRLYGINIDPAIIHYNDRDEQAHLFKKRMVQELHLDYYVEDNWDIVEYLAHHTKACIVWIYNRVDKHFIKYSPGAPNVRDAIALIEKRVTS